MFRCGPARTAVVGATIGLYCDSPAGPSEDLVVTVVDPPRHGTAQDGFWLPDLAHHAVPYDPAPGYSGPDSFTVEVSDGSASDLHVVEVVMSPNQPPECEGPSLSHTRVGQPLALAFSCYDTGWQDWDLAFQVTQPPAHGTIVGDDVEGPDYDGTYSPFDGFTGTDTFTLSASDGDLAAGMTVHVNVADTPWCVPIESFAIRAGKVGEVGFGCTQSEDVTGTLLVRVVDPPGLGTATPESRYPGVRYVADPGSTGTDQFSYQPYVGYLVGNVVSQTVEVLPNAAPVCEPWSGTTTVDELTTVPLTCSDTDADPVTLAVTDLPAHGMVGELVDGQVTYTPAPGFVGVDSFSYAGSDYARTSGPATVTITVTEEDPPVLGWDVATGQSPARVARRGLRLILGTDEAAHSTIRLTVDATTARRLGLVRRVHGPVRVGSLTTDLDAGSTAVRVGLTPLAARGFRRTGRVRLVATYIAADGFGNRSTLRRTLRLRR